VAIGLMLQRADIPPPKSATLSLHIQHKVIHNKIISNTNLWHPV